MASLQQFDKLWISMKKHLQKPKLTNFDAIWQKDILTLDGLEEEQLIQLDDVTRIKLALRNQGQLALFVCFDVSIMKKLWDLAHEKFINIIGRYGILNEYSWMSATPM